MNVADVLAENLRTKYSGLNDRGTPLTTPTHLWVVPTIPSQFRRDFYTDVFGYGQALEANNYMSTAQFLATSWGADLFTELQNRWLNAEQIMQNIMSTFFVGKQIERTAQKLGLNLESTAAAKEQWNNKLHILYTMAAQPSLREYIMEGENITIDTTDAHLNMQLKSAAEKYMWPEWFVWAKLPDSVSGNWVFKLWKETRYKEGTTNEVDVYSYDDIIPVLGNENATQLMIQRNIPDIVAFYNVMTDTSRDTDMSPEIIWKWVTKQILKWPAHMWNTTILDLKDEHEEIKVPETIIQTIKRISVEISVLYRKMFGSTGKQGIDFGVSHKDGKFSVWIMEVNDRVNWSYSLHQIAQKLDLPEDKIIMTSNTPIRPDICDAQLFIPWLYDTKNQIGIVPVAKNPNLDSNGNIPYQMFFAANTKNELVELFNSYIGQHAASPNKYSMKYV